MVHFKFVKKGKCYLDVVIAALNKNLTFFPTVNLLK